MKNLLLLFLLSPLAAFAQPGTLDNDFDADGLKMVDLSTSDKGYDIVVQDDGKILVAGTTSANSTVDFVVVRFQPDGSLDNSFGTSGVATIDFSAGLDNMRSMALQDDGKIMLVGYTANDFALARLNSDGSLDNTFSFDGMLVLPVGTSVDNAEGVEVMADGKIVVVGGAWELSGSNVAVLRFNPDGSLDNTFSFDGIVTTDIASGTDKVFDVHVYDDGKLTVGGHTTAPGLKPILIRYNADGTLDNTFGTNGQVVVDLGSEAGFFNAIEVTGSGKILGAGRIGSTSQAEILVARFLADGSPDISFSFDGLAGSDVFGEEDMAFDLLVQPDGRILCCGYGSNPNRNMVLLRLNNDGTPDTDFGTNGIVTTHPTSYDQFQAIALQADGKIVATGIAGDPDNDIVVARYISGINIGIGEVDAYIGSTLVYPNPISDRFITIEYELKRSEAIKIELLNVEGQLISTLQPTTKMTVGDHTQTFDLLNISAGQYLLNLSSEKGAVQVRLSVVN